MVGLVQLLFLEPMIMELGDILVHLLVLLDNILFLGQMAGELDMVVGFVYYIRLKVLELVTGNLIG